ncbi:MAG: tetratricopeptide repeat protein [Cyclobacteriaceae bacterium]|nr:tetratricopeptide repeat protein [Cyclobacteriaceae bacterium]
MNHYSENINLTKLSKLNRMLLMLIASIFFLVTTLHGQQITTSDSLRISRAIENAHSALAKYDYNKAIGLANISLSESDSLNFSSGLINSLLILAESHKALSEYSSALNYYLQAQAELEKNKNYKELAKTNYKIGQLFFEWGVSEKALAYFNSVLTEDRVSLKEADQIDLLNRIAETYLKLDETDKSQETYQKILTINKNDGETDQIINTLRKIASIYNQQGQYENALRYNFEILELNKQQRDTLQTAVSCNTIGFLYKSLDKLPEALNYFEQALEYNQQINKNGSNYNSIVSNLINIGVIDQSMGDYKNSIKSFSKALNIVEKNGSKVETAVLNNYLASIYLSTGNYSDARKHTLQAIDLLKGTNNIRMMAASQKRLSEIYEKTGSYDLALDSYKQYSIIKDSLLYREQLNQEKEQYKQILVATVEKESKLELIDQEMKALELRNEKVKSEREKQEIELQLKEQELKNISLQNAQLERERQVQRLTLLKEQIEAQRRNQEITVLEQKRDLQDLQLKQNEILRTEKQKEIELQKSQLELQESQLESSKLQKQYLKWTVGLVVVILLLMLAGFITKQKDNRALQTQYDKINEQKESIEKINEELLELNEEKNNLIGIVAHDLKSPLNQISGILDIIKLTSKDQTSEHQEYIDKISDSTKRLKNMVTKILDVNAIESKTLNLNVEEINLKVLLEETIGHFEEMAKKKGIVIHKHFEVALSTAQVDAGYTSEVFENLLSNSIKYSPLDEEVYVKLSESKKTLRAEFIDHGQGISKEDMKNLFGRYHKLSARPTAGEDSTGLGLSIVKKYVEAMNGKVWCESEEGRGSNFIVEFKKVS